MSHSQASQFCLTHCRRHKAYIWVLWTTLQFPDRTPSPPGAGYPAWWYTCRCVTSQAWLTVCVWCQVQGTSRLFQAKCKIQADLMGGILSLCCWFPPRLYMTIIRCSHSALSHLLLFSLHCKWYRWRCRLWVRNSSVSLGVIVHNNSCCRSLSFSFSHLCTCKVLML